MGAMRLGSLENRSFSRYERDDLRMRQRLEAKDIQIHQRLRGFRPELR